MDDFTWRNEKAPAAKTKSYAGMMFKSQSCWNQQALALPFFLQHVPDSEKCLYSKARSRGLCDNKRDRVCRWIRSIRVYTLFYKHVPGASSRAVKPIFFCVCYRFSVAWGEPPSLRFGATLVPLPAGFHIKQIETPHCVMTCTHKHTPDTVYPTMAGRWKEAGGTHRNHSATSRSLKCPED